MRKKFSEYENGALYSSRDKSAHGKTTDFGLRKSAPDRLRYAASFSSAKPNNSSASRVNQFPSGFFRLSDLYESALHSLKCPCMHRRYVFNHVQMG